MSENIFCVSANFMKMLSLSYLWSSSYIKLTEKIMNWFYSFLSVLIHTYSKSCIHSSFGFDSCICVMFIYQIFHDFQVKTIFPLGFYSLLVVPPMLGTMNLFWFWKIAKGLIKTLSKARQSHSHIQ